jgi:hypothetical protein
VLGFWAKSLFITHPATRAQIGTVLDHAGGVIF